MRNMHGVRLTPPEESLAVVERLLRETPRTDKFARFILHLEQRREVLLNEINKGGTGCTGLRSSEANTGTKTDASD